MFGERGKFVNHLRFSTASPLSLMKLSYTISSVSLPQAGERISIKIKEQFPSPACGRGWRNPKDFGGRGGNLQII